MQISAVFSRIDMYVDDRWTILKYPGVQGYDGHTMVSLRRSVWMFA